MSATLARLRTLLPKVSGVILMLFGLLIIYQGASRLDEPGLPPRSAVRTYVMSRQVEDIGTGCIAIMFGVLAYRRRFTDD